MSLCHLIFCLFLVAFARGLPVQWATELGINTNTWQPYVMLNPSEAESGSCLMGVKQSPIDIKCTEEVGSGHINLNGHSDDRPEGFTIANTGHTAQISFNGAAPTLTGTPLNGEYTFVQMHFHWGANNSLGSEHAVDGEYGVFEGHLVHYKTEYGSLNEALNHFDGIAVVGLIFELESEPNTGISEIVDALASIKNYHDLVPLSPSAMSWLKPFKTNFEYYHYQGSLTTPPCAEVVTWLLLEEEVEISADQLAQFRSLLESDGETVMVANRREVQETYGRSVYCSIEDDVGAS